MRELEDVPRDVMNEAAKHFKQITPIRSGNARRKTRLRGNTIRANYPYAGRLDDGYSPQAPEGMTKPTLRFIRKRMMERFRRV